MKPERARPSVAILGTRGYPSYYGGFETAVRKLAPFLAEEGWDVTVYGRDGSTRDDDPDRDERVLSVVTRGTESKSLSTLTYGFWSALDTWKRRPDVALIMNVANGFWLPLLKLRGIPTVVNVDGIEWERAKWGRLAKFVFRAGARLTSWFADELVVDSRVISDRWKSGFGRGGVFIPYGGDVPERSDVPEGLVDRGYVLVVARFVPENTIEEFFAAVHELAEKWTVVLVGSSGYGGELDEAAAALDAAHERVRWLGHVSDDRLLFSLWQHAGVYFHGHSVGGTNPALVQAMACGVAVVARDSLYNREVLGEAGVFVPPNARAIADAIDGLLADPDEVERRGRAARERRDSEYTWESVNEAYETLLAGLAEGVPSSR